MSQWIRDTTRLAIHLRDGLLCVYCARTCPEVVLTLDHLDGGDNNEPGSLVTACWFCNSSRGGTRVEDFCRRLGLRPQTIRRRITRQTVKDLAPYVEVARLLLERDPPSWWMAQRTAAKDAEARAHGWEDPERAGSPPVSECYSPPKVVYRVDPKLGF